MIKRWHVLPILAILVAMIVVVVPPPPSAHAASYQSPSAVSWGSGRLDVFTTGGSTIYGYSTLQHWWSTDGVRWGGPESLG